MNAADQSLLTPLLGKLIDQSGYNADYDLDRNGVINAADQTVIGTMIGRVAAPSGSSSDSYIPNGTGTGMALVPGPDSVISYCGYVNHPRSAMLLARHRWYQPSLGRWMTRDPAGYVDGYNLYAYVNNNPLAYFDPSGLGQEQVDQYWNLANSNDYAGAARYYVMLNDCDRAAVDKKLNGRLEESEFGMRSWLHARWNIFSQSNGVVVNTFSFGATDGLGWTDTDRLQGTRWTLAKASATIAREAAIGALTAGSGSMAVNATQKGLSSANAWRGAAQTLSVVSAGRSAYQGGSGVMRLTRGDAWGLLDIGGALLGLKSAGSALKSLDKVNLGKLTHLTSKANAEAIRTSNQLIGNNFAGPASNATAGSMAKMLQTGVRGADAAVDISAPAQGAFRSITPIGPFTTWQRATGQMYTAKGTLELGTGVFVRQGMNASQLKNYGADIAITGGLAASGALEASQK